MAVTALSDAMHGASLHTSSRQGGTDRDKQRVGTQFEALLIQELVEVMRSAATEGLSSGAGNYMEYFDQTVAESLAQNMDLGLSRQLLGQEDGENVSGMGSSLMTRHAFVPRPQLSPQAGIAAYATTGASLFGATHRLQVAASQMLGAGAQDRWSREGQLQSGDLSAGSTITGLQSSQTQNMGFGYQGYYKCNLFAFELAKRAGFHVPVVQRPEGWGYPASNTVTENLVQDGHVKGGWATVATGQSANSLQTKIQTGHGAFMLSGSAPEGRSGHMAIVERVHDVVYDKDGNVEQVVFDGWEARENGAQYLQRRTWNLRGHYQDEPLSRNGFNKIEIIELKPVLSGTSADVALSQPPKAQFSSSHQPNQPKSRVEG